MFNMMIVDDESLTREFMKLNIPLINTQWQTAYEATDGQEALEILKHHKVDLIITDIKMPVMNGLELCKIVSLTYPNQKIIILSGYDEFTLAREAIRYGVNEYLLKPIVNEELKEAINRITLEISKERNQELVDKTMRTLSEDSKSHVIKNFLKAVISDSHAEIKVLYPLLFRLKVSLIESEGLMMVLSLDEDLMMGKSIPPSDIPVFKYILNQVAAEIIEETNMGKVFYDMDENTVVLITGDHETEMIERCREVYGKVAEVIFNSTAVTVTGAIGMPVNDVLQLNLSYHKARKMLLSRLQLGGGSLYSFHDDTSNLQFINELDKVISAVKSGLLDHNERQYLVSVKNYVELFDQFTIGAVTRYGLYMMESIASLDPGFAGAGAGKAWNLLKSFGLSMKTDPHKEEIIAVFNEIIKSFAQHAEPDQEHYNEHDLVTKAKDYIYAHYSEPISLALIAETIGVSSSYLSNIFHKSVHESYIKFLTRVRMEEAAKLLKSRPSPKVFDVSEKVGYVSVKHFSYVFKQHFNMPPGEFQEKHMNAHASSRQHAEVNTPIA